ncbi:MAG: sulfotransferase domain-containing protein [Melioribacteraceae bacterium]|nr:sulfotransferase domain-containing protein [Melioribacteraceae bacterium]MCF8431221.1 sulfotransferase domain-containing protein [Melioribacteraceae bacterium]
MFANFVLKNIGGLKHVDYASEIYSGKTVEQISFKKYGKIYGPIRLSVEPNTPVFNRLVTPTTKSDFIKNKTAIFFIRDPRDLLVSAYYSFGFTHGFSPVEKIRKVEKRTREFIQANSIDDYALFSADKLINDFSKINELQKFASKSVVIKYEDMIDNWDVFSEGLKKYLNISDSVINQIYQNTRPKVKEDTSSHHRSGKAGGYKNKLTAETIELLNVKFNNIFDAFGYNRF